MDVSNSQIKVYKSCRRLYEFQYIHRIEPIEKAESLERGLSYHKKLEELLSNGEVVIDDNIKTNAMAIAFKKYIYPMLDVKAQEEWFRYNTPNGKHTVLGRIDALDNSGKLIEHKTTSSSITGEYWQNLEFDEQIFTYMYAYKTNKILYTVCQTPTIRQKKNETDEEFQQRCVDWYDEDTESKITMQEIYRSTDDIEKFVEEQEKVIDEIENCNLFFKNQSHCMKWGRMCEFASICNNYIPDQEYVGFQKKEWRR